MSLIPEVRREQPPYIQIADVYRRKIDANEIPEGTRLPPAASIADAWGVAVATAHKALKHLAEEHRIRIVDKQGAWVISTTEYESGMPPEQANLPVPELCEVVMTAPDPEWLVEFTRQLVADGICSSGHNYMPVRSIYKWRGKVHDRTEGHVSLHTRKSLVPVIVQRAKEQHPYDVPGISSRPIEDGNPDYLQWIADQTENS